MQFASFASATVTTRRKVGLGFGVESRLHRGSPLPYDGDPIGVSHCLTPKRFYPRLAPYVGRHISVARWLDVVACPSRSGSGAVVWTVLAQGWRASQE